MTYDAADNSYKSYNLAISELRAQGLRDGRFTPNDAAEELIAAPDGYIDFDGEPMAFWLPKGAEE